MTHGPNRDFVQILCSRETAKLPKRASNFRQLGADKFKRFKLKTCKKVMDSKLPFLLFGPLFVRKVSTERNQRQEVEIVPTDVPLEGSKWIVNGL